MSATIRVEILDDLSRLDRLGAAWIALHAAADGGPFSSLDWLLAWASAYGEGAAGPRIALAWSGDRLVAALPLGLDRARLSRFGPRVHRLAMLCDERAGFHDVLARPGPEGSEALAAIIDFWRTQKGWGLVDLTPMMPSPALDALLEAAHARGLRVWRRHEINRAVCDISAGWEAYLARRSANFRKTIRSGRKRVAAAGGTVRIVHGGEADAGEMLERMLALSARCWKAQMGTDIGSDARIRRFMAEIWARFSQRRAARLLLLTIGERDAASCLLLRAGQREYGFITDFDEDFAELSPGRFLASHALETAAGEGMAVFDMMRATPVWTRLADAVLPLDRVRLCKPLGVAGLWLTLEEPLRPLGRSLRKAYRQRTRKRIAFKDGTSGYEVTHDEDGR